MSYSLAFKEEALKAWKKLGSNVSDKFNKKLEERLLNPRVPAPKLSGHNDRFKIVPIVFWLFSPLFMLISTIGLLFVLYRLDRAPKILADDYSAELSNPKDI